MIKCKILKSVDFAKTQKSKYLENKTLKTLKKEKFIKKIIKNSLITHQVLLYGKKSFLAEVTFKLLQLKYCHLLQLEARHSCSMKGHRRRQISEFLLQTSLQTFIVFCFQIQRRLLLVMYQTAKD